MKHRITALMAACSLALFPLSTFAASAAGMVNTPLTTLQDLLLRINYFINIAVIPLLFGIGLFVFLLLAAYWFIIDRDNTEAKENARQLAVYGTFAFVFLVSIWGLVNLVVSGLGFEREQSLCPDYLKNWCGDQRFDRGLSTPRTGAGNGGTGTKDPLGNTDTDDIDGTPPLVDTGCGSGVTCKESALGNLLFGTFTDTAALSFSNGAPRAAVNTPVISETATCSAGLSTLSLAAARETNQSAYLLYKTAGGVVRFKNLTDNHTTTGIGYDADQITALLTGGATKPVLLHVHPRKTTTAAGLSMDGHGPSAADLALLCEAGVADMTHIVVDWNNIWTITQPTDACPRTSNETTPFPIIDGILALAMIDASDRNSEVSDLLDSNLLPSRFTRDFADLERSNLNALSADEVMSLALPYTTASNLTITRTTANAFCTGY